jgi:hypothetical protein
MHWCEASDCSIVFLPWFFLVLVLIPTVLMGLFFLVILIFSQLVVFFPSDFLHQDWGEYNNLTSTYTFFIWCYIY